MVVAVAGIVLLALWPVEIHRAFGLPAHPLIIHVPVIFVPVLGLVALWAAAKPRLFVSHGVQIAGFAVVTMASTLLAVGAGEAFEEDRTRGFGGFVNPTLQEHQESGETLRWIMVAFTALLVLAMLAYRLPRSPVGRALAGPGKAFLRLLIALAAVAAIFFVIRTGHLGAKLAWGQQGFGGAPPGFNGRPGGGGG